MFLRILGYDLKNYFIKSSRKLIIAAIVFVFFLIGFYVEIRNIIISDRLFGIETVNFQNLTFMDCCLCFFKGMGEYIPSTSQAFEFPAIWILFYLLIFYFVLHYPFNDLMGYGKYVLLLSRSRLGWWLSKCVTTIVWVFSYFVLAWSEIAIFCLFSGIKFSLSLSPNAVAVFVPTAGDAAQVDLYLKHSMFPTVIILPLLTAIGLALSQQVLSLIIKPFYSYIVTVVILLVSSYYMNPFIIGNYAMTVRSDLLLSNGVNAGFGTALCVGLILASVIVGGFIFKRYDILNKE